MTTVSGPAGGPTLKPEQPETAESSLRSVVDERVRLATAEAPRPSRLSRPHGQRRRSDIELVR